MKKTMAFLLAVAMLAGLAVNAFAATDIVSKYPVTEVSSDAYLWDDDENRVDLSDSVDMVPYGETAYFPLINDTVTGGPYYVYESEAAGNIKVSKKWEEGSSYVKNIEVVKKKAMNPESAKIPSGSYVYFLAIEIKDSSSTADREVYGEITLKQSGKKNKYDDLDSLSVDIAFEVGYDSASKKNSEGEIPKTPATFKSGSGFEYDSEYEFSFEAASDCMFVVNTNGQSKIVLGFDIEYDDDIADDYPDADLYFFNGNYATFNRTGTLYLGNDDPDLYVYSISSNGSISRIDAEYDDSEEAYVIKTRTLGRYMLSDSKLKIKSTDNDSSSSKSSSAVVRPASSAVTSTVPSYTTPSSTYTPPASSYTPPASSAPPASSSTPESSEPEEDEDLEDEDWEDEDWDDEDWDDEENEDDVVDVIVDDDEGDEEPEKKKGLPGWGWALIIAGLAAIPIAIGAIYVIQTRPTKREFFDDYDEYDDDDDE